MSFKNTGKNTLVKRFKNKPRFPFQFSDWQKSKSLRMLAEIQRSRDFHTLQGGPQADSTALKVIKLQFHILFNSEIPLL